jgi:hypothetical protein
MSAGFTATISAKRTFARSAAAGMSDSNWQNRINARQLLEDPPMNDYEVTYTNGEVAIITAWTPEAALAIAEEDGELYGCPGMEAVSANLMSSQPTEA